MRLFFVCFFLIPFLAAPSDAQVTDSFIEVESAPYHVYESEDGDVVPVVYFRDEEGRITAQPVPRGTDPDPRRGLEGTRAVGAVVPFASAELSTSQLVAVGVGVMIGSARADDIDGSKHLAYEYDFRGAFLSAEAGFGGFKAKVGYTETSGATFLIIPLMHVGASLGLSVYHAWSDAGVGSSADATYGGLEGELQVYLMKLTAGAYRKLSQDPGAQNYFFNLGIGVHVPLALGLFEY